MGVFSSSSPKLTYPTISKNQILLSSLLAFVFSLVITFCESPFSKGLAAVGFISGVFHLGLYFAFDRVYPMRALTFSWLTILNFVLMGFAMHYTGGILSPFVFVFFFILISDFANGNNYPSGLVAALIVYGAVVGGEYAGILEPRPLSTEVIYSSPFSVILIVSSFVLFILIVGHSYKLMIGGLRRDLEAEHKHYESARKQLARLDAPSQTGLLVNKIVHDVRGPLGAVSGFVHMLKNERGLSDESKEDCALMSAELTRITNLMNRLIKYTKPGGQEKILLSPVDLVETVLSVVSFYPGAKSVTYQRRFSQSRKLKIFAVKEEIQQVLFNVFKNSIEAFERGNRPRVISTRVHASRHDIFIEIRDNGRGIPRRVLSKMFEENVSTKEEGAGVGLVIASEILQAHYGHLDIQSQEGVGTKVTIQLPQPTHPHVQKLIKEDIQNQKPPVPATPPPRLRETPPVVPDSRRAG